MEDDETPPDDGTALPEERPETTEGADAEAPAPSRKKAKEPEAAPTFRVFVSQPGVVVSVNGAFVDVPSGWSDQPADVRDALVASGMI